MSAAGQGPEVPEGCRWPAGASLVCSLGAQSHHQQAPGCHPVTLSLQTLAEGSLPGLPLLRVWVNLAP